MTAAPAHAHREVVGPGRTLLLRLERGWLFDAEEVLPLPGAPRTRIQIGDFAELGRGLVLDGSVQLTEAIDTLYTSALVLPAALVARRRARWLILGGGDGATAREALRFRDTEEARVVEISSTVVDQTRALIPSFWGGCTDDPRVRVDIGDAWEALRAAAASGPSVDVLVADLSDPADQALGGSSAPADRLYSEEAFALAAQCLGPDGVLVAQASELSTIRSEPHRLVRRAVESAFRHVRSYRVFIEAFGCWESFVIASNHEGPWDPSDPSGAGDRLSALYRGRFDPIWSPGWHASWFGLPPALQL